MFITYCYYSNFMLLSIYWSTWSWKSCLPTHVTVPSEWYVCGKKPIFKVSVRSLLETLWLWYAEILSLGRWQIVLFLPTASPRGKKKNIYEGRQTYFCFKERKIPVEIYMMSWIVWEDIYALLWISDRKTLTRANNIPLSSHRKYNPALGQWWTRDIARFLPALFSILFFYEYHSTK